MAKTPKQDIKNPDKPLQGEVVNSNDNILSNEQEYFLYILDNVKRICSDYGIKYAGIVDSRKSHPDFTYNQFLFILAELKTRVYSVNRELLCDNYINIYNPNYNHSKVELAYSIYNKLCKYYGFNCTDTPFYDMTGIEEARLYEWLSSGTSDLLKTIKENAKNNVLTEFENSSIPILKLASANYKHGLTTPQQEKEVQAAVDVLPDLQALTQRKRAALKAPEN
jgi:hypothetical protein